jgi:hypothetical protein
MASAGLWLNVVATLVITTIVYFGGRLVITG